MDNRCERLKKLCELCKEELQYLLETRSEDDENYLALLRVYGYSYVASEDGGELGDSGESLTEY